MDLTELTPTRRDLLIRVGEGHVIKMWPFDKRKPYFAYRNGLIKPYRPALDWLMSNGYIRLDRPSLRGTPVVLTKVGVEAVAQLKKEENG